MSTRANIILKEGNEKLYFYRHSDGYPAGTLPTLNKFIEWLKAGEIRNNLSQGSGWLIVLGAIEYNTIPEYKTETVEYFKGHERTDTIFESIGNPKDWKVGAYEPTTDLHGDIDYLYTINLLTKEISVERAKYDLKTHQQSFVAVHQSELA